MRPRPPAHNNLLVSLWNAMMSEGELELGTDHARAPLLDGADLPALAPLANTSVCLYNLRVDLNETTNVADKPDHQDLVQSLLARLKVRTYSICTPPCRKDGAAFTPSRSKMFDCTCGGCLVPAFITFARFVDGCMR